MSNYFDNVVVEEKVLNKDLRIRMLKNESTGRILVEFSNIHGKMIVQKSFQDNFVGRQLAETFKKSMKSLKDLNKYLGLSNKEKKNVASKAIK